MSRRIDFFHLVLVAQRSDVLKNLYLEELRGFKPPSESELVKILGSFTPASKDEISATRRGAIEICMPRDNLPIYSHTG